MSPEGQSKTTAQVRGPQQTTVSRWTATFTSLPYVSLTEEGGGVYCSDSDVTLMDTDLSGNVANTDNDFHCSTVVGFTECTVLGNSKFTDSWFVSSKECTVDYILTHLSLA
jgi:hypothetical protein